jgi:translation initiation factor IF-1
MGLLPYTNRGQEHGREDRAPAVTAARRSPTAHFAPLKPRPGSTLPVRMSQPYPDEIRAPARVIELMRDKACRVELPNGHRAVGQSRSYAPVLGESVIIAFHPYDLSRGWIVPAQP